MILSVISVPVAHLNNLFNFTESNFCIRRLLYFSFCFASLLSLSLIMSNSRVLSRGRGRKLKDLSSPTPSPLEQAPLKSLGDSQSTFAYGMTSDVAVNSPPGFNFCTPANKHVSPPPGFKNIADSVFCDASANSGLTCDLKPDAIAVPLNGNLTPQPAANVLLNDTSTLLPLASSAPLHVNAPEVPDENFKANNLDISSPAQCNATADGPKAADVAPVNCANYGVMQPVVGYVPLHASFAAGNVKLPQFWEDDAELWFSTAETTFTIKGIRSETLKLECLLASLDRHHVRHISHVISAENCVKPFSDAKQILLTKFALDRDAKIEELLYDTKLTSDLTPSELLTKMRDLIGDNQQKNSDLLRKLFLDQMPADARRLIAAAGEQDLDQIACIADRIVLEERRLSSRFHNAAVKSPPQRRYDDKPQSMQMHESALERQVTQLASAVDKLNTSVASLQPTKQTAMPYKHPAPTNNNRRPFSNSRPSDFSNTSRLYNASPVNAPPRDSDYPPNHPFCFYHWKFGPRARQCVGNCSWGPTRRSPVRNPRGPPVGMIDDNFFGWQVRDPCSHIVFMIDTGSTLSLLPSGRRQYHDIRFSGFLNAANGSKIPRFEKRRISVTLGMSQVFTWDFVMADVDYAIIGMDFLQHFDLSLNPRSKSIFFNQNLEGYANNSTPQVHASNKTSGIPQNRVRATLPEPQIAKDFNDLSNLYPCVFDLENFNRPTHHQTKHHIRTKGPPISEKVRRLNPEKLQCLRKELKKFLDLGIIERAESPYAAPLHMVPKKNGEYRITGDYRKLNLQTIPDKYAIPLLTDFTEQLAGATIFSSLDLFKSYYQIEVAEEDVHKTAIITPLGNFVFKRLPMGLRSAGNTFQKFMDEVFRDQSNVYVYIDDVLVFSKTPEEHLQHLSEVFNRLDRYGLILNKDKCVFGAENIEFLGHCIDKMGVKPLEKKTKNIREFPKPSTMRELRRWLGMVNFYRRFIKDAGKILVPLERVLSPKKGSRESISWNSEMECAFNTTKEILAEITSLAFPVKGAETFISVDASDVGVGGSLNQVIDGEVKPLGFFSRTLNKTQRNYSTFDRELLAIFLTIQHFEYFLDSRDFYVLSDHKPLATALTAPLKEASGRRLRQAQYISQFTSDIRYIKGVDNVVADCLSRPPEINAIFSHPQSIDVEQIAREQVNDPVIKRLASSDNHSLQIQKVILPDSSIELLVDTSTGTTRVVVPQVLREKVFKSIHSLSHPGVRTSVKLISQRFVWEGMRKDIANFTKSCIQCQSSKIQRHNVAPLEKFLAPDERFSHVHVDIVGPLPESNGCTHLLTVIDRSRALTLSMEMDIRPDR